LRKLGPQDNFGELAILKDGKRTATVVAMTACQMLVVNKEAFLKMHPKVEGEFWRDY
jgi:CRP-like cAMP-binding protein